MGSLIIKLPDSQKKEIDALAERKNYNSTSEYVREALRNKVEEDLVLRPEVAEELRKWVKEYKKGDVNLVSHEELKEELDLW